jgi:hypothetical protein
MNEEAIALIGQQRHKKEKKNIHVTQINRQGR